MLDLIKEKQGLKGYELAKFLDVSEPTIYAWEKKNTWPLWALEKCGVSIKSLLGLLQEINEMCIGEITMNYRLDAEYIGRKIYAHTGMNVEQMRDCT